MKFILSDAFPFLCGLALVTAGAFWVYPPAGLFVPGLVLLYVALSRDREKERPE